MLSSFDKESVGKFMLRLTVCAHMGEVAEAISNFMAQHDLSSEYEDEDCDDIYGMRLAIADAFGFTEERDELLEDRAEQELYEKAAALYYEEIYAKGEYFPWYSLDKETQQIYIEKAKQQ